MESPEEPDTLRFDISLLRDKMETILEQVRNMVAKINYRFNDDGLWEKNTMINTPQFDISLLRDKMETILEQVRNMVAKINYRFTDDGIWEKNNMISEVKAVMESRIEQGPMEMEDDWPYMRTHSRLFNPPVSERVHRCEMEDCWSDMRTHSGLLNPPRRTTYKEQEQIKEDNFKRIRECKENTSNVNGPEIQQPNHDVIDKEQQPGQDVIGVRKSSQTAKGVKMEMLFSFLKYFLVIILVGFPVADCNHRDFKWLPTNTTVKGVYQTDVQLVWKYQSNSMLDKIDISRKKTEYEKKQVSLWTPDEDSKPNTSISTDVTLEHRKKGDVGSIILTLIKPYPVDFDKQYYCTVYFENGLDSMEIELQSYKVEYQPVADVVEARPGDDVQFVWIYKCPLPLTFVDFYKDDDIQNEILTWRRSDGVYNIKDEYKNRATVTITTYKYLEEVTLTLRNVTIGDFHRKYCSLSIVTTGIYKTSKIILIPLPVEEEKPKPVRETISAPSSASRLSKVSMFLICSVLLLAV